MPDIKRIIMNAQTTAMILASFAADSLALGAHWIYDTDEIDRRIGRIDGLRRPLPESYHPTKEKGDFTHYGDQTLVLLESLAKNGGFSPANFAAAWKGLFTDYRGYIDKATAATLDNMNRQMPPDRCGSQSSELGGAARIAPLLFFYRDDRPKLLETVRQQTAMTHNSPASLAGAEFIAKAVWNVLQGTRPIAALENALEEGVADIDLDNRIRAGLDSAGHDTRTVIKNFGQMCSIAAALPGVVHLITTYENDLKKALIENVMAGGDSAARGLVAGMILGAHLGRKAIPEDWLTDMVKFKHISALLSSGGDIDEVAATIHL
jgi:ADP-ribosylglycohydrolase